MLKSLMIALVMHINLFGEAVAEGVERVASRLAVQSPLESSLSAVVSVT